MKTTLISIIIPVLDEEDHIGSLLKRLPDGLEVIVVDGGSKDSTVDLVSSLGYKVISSERGRALQMNAGAAQSKGEILIFLHADCMLPDDFDREISMFSFSDRAWGRFNVRIDGHHMMFRIIEWMINGRSRLTGICTGDQAIFVRRSTFEMIGGMPAIPLMEDIEVSKRLKKVSRPYIVRSQVQTSARRWLEGGIFRTILLMWRFRLVYLFGTSPEVLAEEYYG
jgi:rSAM/selenodomain-associated transferase 2